MVTAHPNVIFMHIRESTIEQELIEKLDELKYTLRPDIRDRVAKRRSAAMRS